MTKTGVELAQIIKIREHLAYEHHLARSSYAYGVDLRRSAWLGRSTLGQPLMRAVDRRWNELVTDLIKDGLEGEGQATPPGDELGEEVLAEVLALVRTLHAPIPAIRTFDRAAARGWPVVTPLGTTQGGCHWLVIDRDRLEAADPAQRTFWLASGLGHLQCDHGPLFTAHLMAHRSGRARGLVRTLLRPWWKVAAFSADRAGLIALDDLDDAREALRAHASTTVSWLPPSPDVALRIRALEEFAKSRTLARLRFGGPRPSWTLAPNLASPSRPPPAAPAPDPASEPEAPAANGGSQAEPTSSVAEAEAEGERLAAEQEARDLERELRENELAEAQARAKALAEAWPLARCDQRLTRRLGLL